MLEKVNLNRSLSREEYKLLMPALQRRLYDLEKACWDQEVASLILFEGWDAAGKGGAIATLTQRLDPRGFKLHSIDPPRTFEQNRPWLWRFWLRIPNRGEMVILDHSWYRRVLGDRVEKRIPQKEWRAAYQDVNEFERMLADDGVAIVKFFFHIARKEQRRRFRKLEKNPFESWRIDEAAWRQNERYDDYLEAAEEMLEVTESDVAPWTIVEATSRWHARRRVFETVIQALEVRLGDKAPVTEAPEEEADRDAEVRDALELLEQLEEAATGEEGGDR
jgi:polyphosphate kinase 2 (PPK2 family)